jgi:hypothetical protein
MFHEVLLEFIDKNFKVLKGWMSYVFLNKDKKIYKMEKNGWNDHELGINIFQNMVHFLHRNLEKYAFHHFHVTF